MSDPTKADYQLARDILKRDTGELVNQATRLIVAYRSKLMDTTRGHWAKKKAGKK